MSGRILAGGLVLFALIFGAALWWFQTRGHYERVSGLTEITVGGQQVVVEGYQGLDAATSPLKLRGCFRSGPIEAPFADRPEPLVAPGWFGCFDAETLARDIESAAATAYLAEFNAPYGFDRIVARYPNGAAYQWRQMNKCGEAAFAGDPLPEGCPPAPKGYE